MVLLCDVFSGAFFRAHAATVSFGYDANGNRISQQAASAAAPVILGSAPSQVVGLGGIGGFSVNIASPLAVTYQWHFNGVAISGATGDSLLLTNITSANDGNYTVTVTNSSGSVTSSTYRLGFDGSGNGLPDSWEQTYFGNLNQTAGGDYDGDSISNLDEYFDGTDPTVREIYYWIAPSGDFNTASNWNRNRVPGAGDTAIINTGTFTISANTTIAVSQVTVNVPFTAPTDANFTLRITGSWVFNGPFTLASGRQFAVTDGGTATIIGSTNLNGANLFVSEGAKLFFPALTSYTVPGGASVNWYVRDNNSELTFASLATIAGNATPDRYFDITGQYGTAKINFPALTTITKPNDADTYRNSGVRLYAYNGTVISAPVLSAFNDNDALPYSLLTASGSSAILVPQLFAPKGVSLNLNAQSSPQQFNSLLNAYLIEVNGGTVSLGNLSSLAGTSHVQATGGANMTFPNVTNLGSASIYVSEGAKLFFPALTNYTVPAGASVNWYVRDNNSELTFANLATITGTATPDRYFDITGQYGTAKINFPALTTITKPNDADPYRNSGVRLYAYNGTVISAPVLSAFNDNDALPYSLLTATGTSAILVPQLFAPKGVSLNLNAQSSPQQFTSLLNAYLIEVNGGAVSFGNLSSLAGTGNVQATGGANMTFPNVMSLGSASIYVSEGAKLLFPALTSYTVPAGASVNWYVRDNNSELTLANLATITGNATPDRYFDITGQYGTARINFPALTTIIKPNDADPYRNSGVRFFAYNGTIISAPVLSAFNDNDALPYSLLTATGSSAILVPQLFAPKGVSLNLNAHSNPQQFTSLTNAYSLEVNGGTVSFGNLSSLAGLGLVEASGGANVTFPNVTNLGFASITVSGGAKLAFPAMTSYTVPEGASVNWYVRDNESELSFANLTTITGNATPERYFDITGQYGTTRINFPALTTITKPGDGDPYRNSGVRFFAYNGTVISAPLLSTFNDNDSHPNSSLYADAGGTMNLYSLALSGIRGVTLNGVTLPATVPPPKAINLSTRMLVQTGDNVGIGGFIITGSTTKRVIIRAIGPSLAAFGVPNALPDPVLELHGPSAFVTITNNNWRDTQENEIQTTGIPPTNNLESAIVVTLVPGAYTAIVRGNGGSSGVGLVEVYDLNQAVDAKLANLSTRAAVSTGDNIVIAGFVLGIGRGSDRIVVRGIGPSLTAFGVPNALADPKLELRDANGSLFASNNNWQDDPGQAAELTGAGLAPKNNLESAIAATLPPGLYTALLSGLNGAVGNAVVEVYDRGGPP